MLTRQEMARRLLKRDRKAMYQIFLRRSGELALLADLESLKRLARRAIRSQEQLRHEDAAAWARKLARETCGADD